MNHAAWTGFPTKHGENATRTTTGVSDTQGTNKKSRPLLWHAIKISHHFKHEYILSKQCHMSWIKAISLTNVAGSSVCTKPNNLSVPHQPFGSIYVKAGMIVCDHVIGSFRAIECVTVGVFQMPARVHHNDGATWNLAILPVFNVLYGQRIVNVFLSLKKREHNSQ